ncbi:hypothetical protein [Modestobacter sp. VKM Ac-2985]|uniref:hypothetical protein n=1 Tax=Modestobacter sp. VKM Ac-2985 TaxID=3004139 RepID=UPI0022AB79B0|nr:hypothetical protein [Modestobacter sp. VKM Ac-2985]MCZ2839101.1 hypothetical protein [Modestobacter sp. VKM Ac-2985]
MSWPATVASSQTGTVQFLEDWLTLFDPQSLEVLGHVPALDQADAPIDLDSHDVAVAAGTNLALDGDIIAVRLPEELGEPGGIDVTTVVSQAKAPVISDVPVVRAPVVVGDRVWWSGSGGTVPVTLEDRDLDGSG